MNKATGNPLPRMALPRPGTSIRMRSRGKGFPNHRFLPYTTLMDWAITGSNREMSRPVDHGLMGSVSGRAMEQIDLRPLSRLACIDHTRPHPRDTTDQERCLIFRRGSIEHGIPVGTVPAAIT